MIDPLSNPLASPARHRAGTVALAACGSAQPLGQLVGRVDALALVTGRVVAILVEMLAAEAPDADPVLEHAAEELVVELVGLGQSCPVDCVDTAQEVAPLEVPPLESFSCLPRMGLKFVPVPEPYLNSRASLVTRSMIPPGFTRSSPTEMMKQLWTRMLLDRYCPLSVWIS